MTQELAGRSIVITGAARGIGETIAQGLAADGACITIGDLDKDQAEAAAARIRERGGKAIGVAADVTDRAAVKAMLDAAEKAFGRLHGIVNNAGIAQVKPFLEITEADWRRIMEVNSLGVLIGMQEAARRLIAQGGGGKIVNMSSIAGRDGAQLMAHYSASKFTVVAFTQAGAKDLGPHKINVNAICPGIVGTEMWKDIGRGFKEIGLGETEDSAFEAASTLAVLGRGSRPDDLVGVTRFLMSSGSDFMTGQSLVVDGGMVYR